jgi:hypothetical protein
MGLKRRATDEAVDSAERLSDYTVTRAPSVFAGTGLPVASARPAQELPESSAAEDGRFSLLAVPPHLHRVEERRDEVRCAIALSIVAEHPGRESGLDGVTVDISGSGLCAHMPEEPAGMHEDLLVADEIGVASVWAQIVQHRPAPEGGWTWHLKVVAADDGWEPLVERARDRNAGVLAVRGDHVSAIA